MWPLSTYSLYNIYVVLVSVLFYESYQSLVHESPHFYCKLSDTDKKNEVKTSSLNRVTLTLWENISCGQCRCRVCLKSIAPLIIATEWGLVRTERAKLTREVGAVHGDEVEREKSRTSQQGSH